jgi:hypothetical protein
MPVWLTFRTQGSLKLAPGSENDRPSRSAPNGSIEFPPDLTRLSLPKPRLVSLADIRQLNAADRGG